MSKICDCKFDYCNCKEELNLLLNCINTGGTLSEFMLILNK